ncbi:LacI family transcriptional regulator [Bordetella pertussis]|nr:LacI family transcriptional regulator [Bordetella pertussis]
MPQLVVDAGYYKPGGEDGLRQLLALLERMGYLATAMLVDIVEGRGEPQAGLCLPHESVIVRDSTARPPGRKARAATR